MREQPIMVEGKIRLADCDPDFCGACSKEAAKKATRKHVSRIADLQRLLYANADRSLLLVFQGLDASGKDGAIKNVLRCVGPIGVEVASFKVPSDEEEAHDFLWRVHRKVPRYGNIGLFNRSHYEAVVTERIVKKLPRAVYRRRYEQIVEFEQLLVENQVTVLKFFLHVSRSEQKERLRERLELREKRWKFSSRDLETRRHWKDYIRAYEDAINATSHKAAPWQVVPANHKWYRNYVITGRVLAAMEQMKLRWPEPKEDLSKIEID